MKFLGRNHGKQVWRYELAWNSTWSELLFLMDLLITRSSFFMVSPYWFLNCSLDIASSKSPTTNPLSLNICNTVLRALKSLVISSSDNPISFSLKTLSRNSVLNYYSSFTTRCTGKSIKLNSPIKNRGRKKIKSIQIKGNHQITDIQHRSGYFKYNAEQKWVSFKPFRMGENAVLGFANRLSHVRRCCCAWSLLVRGSTGLDKEVFASMPSARSYALLTYVLSRGKNHTVVGGDCPGRRRTGRRRKKEKDEWKREKAKS